MPKPSPERMREIMMRQRRRRLHKPPNKPLPPLPTENVEDQDF